MELARQLGRQAAMREMARRRGYGLIEVALALMLASAGMILAAHLLAGSP